MKRLTVACLIAASTLGTFVIVAGVIVAGAQNNPYASGHTNPYNSGGQTNPYNSGAQTNPYGGAQIRPIGPPRIPLVGPAQTTRAPYWPPLTGGAVVHEEYSDLPWHQKLGTFAGNELDEVFVLPYGALPPENQKFCNSPTSAADQARCMIETGINSILNYERTDTVYDWKNSTDVQNAQKCKATPPVNGLCADTIGYCNDPSKDNSPCIEVNLAVSMYWSRGNNVLVQRPFGNETKSNLSPAVYDSGLVFTDGTAYAPQMPWYMSHYCNYPTITGQGPVCDDDYFTTINDGFNVTSTNPADNSQWPKSNAPWSVYPNTSVEKGGLPPNTGPNHCPQYDPNGVNLTTCTFVLGAFDLWPVPGNASYDGQFSPNNAQLLAGFNTALARFSPTDDHPLFTTAEFQRHFPWRGTALDWGKDVYPQARGNPFVGQYPVAVNGGQTSADHFLYPRKCTPADLAATDADVTKLRSCGVDFEVHPNGWTKQWPAAGTTHIDYQKAIADALMLVGNQYGRTSFLLAGVPGMQLPVSYYKNPSCGRGGCLSIYEQVHNTSLFSLNLPIANEADYALGKDQRWYTNLEFYHTLLMTNHMESDKDTFADGIRGRTLWHNEYRSQLMYGTNGSIAAFPTVTFPATASGNAPYHNATCDGCHVRNGSGIPIKLDATLDPVLWGQPGCKDAGTCYMNTGAYSPFLSTGGGSAPDYTFTGQIKPMKLVFFDLRRAGRANNETTYSDPQGQTFSAWANKIMNFYGDSFHVTAAGHTYSWSYGPADDNRLVVTTPRLNQELGPISGQNYTYKPQQVNLVKDSFAAPCTTILPTPRVVPKSVWPQNCSEVSGSSIYDAIYTPTPFNKYESRTQVGFMLLNGKRLGNLGAMETIPNGGVADSAPAMSIRGFQQSQMGTLGSATVEQRIPPGCHPVMPPDCVANSVVVPISGAIPWNVGTRGGFGRPGVLPSDQKMACGKSDQSLAKCWIGRFGWIGDRVSLEDQVANAAFIEMNMTTPNGNGYGPQWTFPVRYNLPNCGPADQNCVASKATNGNGKLIETDINRMADYARWLGDPTRSEFMVSLQDVIDGETIFRNIQCNTCHVIDKIPITDPNDTMLPPVFRNRLATHVAPPTYPFLSYLGTDLLMHDMGYLSQVGIRNPGGALASGIRDATTGVVIPGYENYVQKIRTPALKGLRFNRFVTDSFYNTRIGPIALPDPNRDKLIPPTPACDFLLHDGRACDAIEAAFLHDGPAIKKLGTIDSLNNLDKTKLQKLRAFLYSL